MEKEEYQKMHNFEQFYWWHVGRRDIFKKLLSKYLKDNKNKILEIGCGTGGNLEVLNNFGEVTGLDRSKSALKFCRDKGFGNVMLAEAEKTGLPPGSFDVVVAFDVLEHIEDDVGAMREIHSLLKDGGIFLATVPAYNFLWSGHDEALHHLRRYTLKQFSRKLNDAGFSTIKKSYIISFLFPAIAAFRLLEKVLPGKKSEGSAYVIFPEAINNFFTLLLKAEARILSYFNFPVGTSVVCVARKTTKPKLA